MKCIWCLSGQCVHRPRHHEDGSQIPDAITVQDGDAYCADCIVPYVMITRERIRRGEFYGLLPWTG